MVGTQGMDKAPRKRNAAQRPRELSFSTAYNAGRTRRPIEHSCDNVLHAACDRIIQPMCSNALSLDFGVDFDSVCKR